MFTVHVLLGLNVFSLFKVIVIHYHTNKATLRAEVPFSQWQWLLAWQLSESMRMPLQILKAMPEKNKKSAWRVASKKKLNQGYNLIVTESAKKSTSLTCKQALCGTLTALLRRGEKGGRAPRRACLQVTPRSKN